MGGCGEEDQRKVLVTSLPSHKCRFEYAPRDLKWFCQTCNAPHLTRSDGECILLRDVKAAKTLPSFTEVLYDETLTLDERRIEMIYRLNFKSRVSLLKNDL